MSGQAKHMETRAGNALHPGYKAGVAQPVQKCCMKMQMEVNRATEAAAKAAAEEQKSAQIQHIIEVEQHIAEEEALNNTPCPPPHHATCPLPKLRKPLQQNETPLDIQTSADKGNDNKGDYTSDADFIEASEGGDTDAQEDARPKKKAKPTVHNAVDKACGELVDSRKEKAVEPQGAAAKQVKATTDGRSTDVLM
jgi:hypothetical protein